MKASIADGKVYVEGESHDVDVDDMPSYIHAVQWYGSYGEVEFKPDRDGRKLPNLRFSDLAPFEFMIDRWKQRKAFVDAKLKREKEEKDTADKARSDAEEAQRSERPM